MKTTNHQTIKGLKLNASQLLLMLLCLFIISSCKKLDTPESDGDALSKARNNIHLANSLIGYLENLGSDRRIINTVSMRLDDMFYFIGYDIDEPLPWHSTLILSTNNQTKSPKEGIAAVSDPHRCPILI